MAASAAEDDSVTVYWRPGCVFCHRLLAQLRQAEIDVELHNIWEDPDAAAFVRSVARGNETVPTVTVQGRSLVNPAASEVVAAVRSGGTG